MKAPTRGLTKFTHNYLAIPPTLILEAPAVTPVLFFTSRKNFRVCGVRPTNHINRGVFGWGIIGGYIAPVNPHPGFFGLFQSQQRHDRVIRGRHMACFDFLDHHVIHRCFIFFASRRCLRSRALRSAGSSGNAAFNMTGSIKANSAFHGVAQQRQAPPKNPGTRKNPHVRCMYRPWQIS